MAESPTSARTFECRTLRPGAHRHYSPGSCLYSARVPGGQGHRVAVMRAHELPHSSETPNHPTTWRLSRSFSPATSHMHIPWLGKIRGQWQPLRRPPPRLHGRCSSSSQKAGSTDSPRSRGALHARLPYDVAIKAPGLISCKSRRASGRRCTSAACTAAFGTISTMPWQCLCRGEHALLSAERLMLAERGSYMPDRSDARNETPNDFARVVRRIGSKQRVTMRRLALTHR